MRRVFKRLIGAIRRQLPELPDTGDATGIRRLRLMMRAVLKLNGDAGWLARSFAVGVFVAVSPIYGTHTISIIALIALLRLHPLVALIGSLTNPPPLAPFVYSFAFALGRMISGASLRGEGFPRTVDQFKALATSKAGLIQVVLPFFVGCTVLGLAAGLIAFFLVRFLVIKHRRLKEKAHA